jgi:thiol-disulfide isomerase/thioredoxin
MQKLLNSAILFLVTLSLLLIGYYFLREKLEVSQKQNRNYTQLEATSKQLFPPLNTTFTFKTLQNKVFKVDAQNSIFKIQGLEEKLVFLKIFGWNCQYCKKEIPELIKLKSDLGETFEIIAIEAQHSSKEESKKKIKEYGINYNIVLGDEQQNFYAYLKAYYGWSGIIPLTIVLDKKGKVLAFELGAKSYSFAELMKASLTRED